MSVNEPKPLSSSQVALLKKTFKAMDKERLTMRFYSSLFVRYPRLRTLFPTDLTVLSTKIAGVFELVLFSFEERGEGQYFLQKELLRPLRSLGILHEEKGVQNTHYPLVNQMLLESIRAEITDFDDATELAWMLALNHLTVAMITDTGSVNESRVSMNDPYQEIRALLFKTGDKSGT